MDDIAELRSEAGTSPVHGLWARGGPVFSQLTDDTVHALEATTIATFGDSATVGMWAFATGSLTTGLFQANLLPTQQMALLFPLLLVYSGPVLLVAGFLLFRRNNSFLGSAFCSFGAFNSTRGLLLLCESHGFLPSGATANILQGVLSEVFAYIALTLLIGALRMNVVLVLVAACTAIGFGLAGLPVHRRQDHQGTFALVGEIGGYFMLAAALFAFYGGSALLVNTAWQGQILPIGGKA
jgi:succinate-acetate transporter protein